MKRVLLVRAGYGSDLVDQFLLTAAVWVGWSRLDDLAGLTPADVEALLLQQYPHARTRSGQPNKHHLEIIDFALTVKPGDVTVTPDSRRGRLLVGTISAPYRFETASRMHSGGERFRHSIPVRWTHAVHRDDLSDATLREVDQRGKSTFLLGEVAASEVLSASEHPLV